ncbi:LysR family transcriptional regulator [Erysipelothrix amsterdamensis]|uniref:LysR family transcriptional regulator n=1 Tax=Erysipelothrix amsterdamensis TaxID=2929157 RepID=A0AAU9VGC6_9FIRM|nr:LysR family transcriptional regulator [Erysipelothrix sp. A18Y020d]CAH2763833.1 LysR family transcriptional regulator [Erysipelothrix sp. A18Y020d]
MNIRLLKIFKEVYELKSITKATETLYISQPAVSQAVKELETVLNRNLFVRKSGGIEPTPFGAQFYLQVTHFLKGYHQFEADVFKLNKSNPLRIGSSITVAKTTLPDIIKRYESLHLEHKTETTIANAQDVLALLIEDKVDVAIIEGSMHDETFETIELGTYSLKFFSKYPHNISNLESLLQHRVLLRESGSSIRNAFEALLLKHKLVYHPTWQTVNSEAILFAVRQDLGIGFLPEVLIHHDFYIYDDITTDITTPITLCYRKNQVFEDPLNEFVDIVLEAFGK